MRSLAAAYTFVTVLLGSSALSADMSAPQLIRRACAAYDLRAIILVEEGARTHKPASVLAHEAFVILEARALCAGDQPISGLVLYRHLTDEEQSAEAQKLLRQACAAYDLNITMRLEEQSHGTTITAEEAAQDVWSLIEARLKCGEGQTVEGLTTYEALWRSRIKPRG